MGNISAQNNCIIIAVFHKENVLNQNDFFGCKALKKKTGLKKEKPC